MDSPPKREVSSPEFPGGLIYHPLSIREVNEVATMGSICLSNGWTEKEYAYFLCHECGFCRGLSSGSVLLSLFIGLLVQGELDVVLLGTRPECRRRHLAEEMLNMVSGEGVVRKMFLEVARTNVAAINLYRKVGFKALGKRVAYYQGKTDAIRMVRSPSIS